MRQGSKGYTSGMNASVPTNRCPASWPITKKPVKAVPARNQAKGRRYQGETEMR